ncbi:hypothetical protein KDW81_13355 [Burkholderia dolosa]|nr:hypothetical protein [Burkholderia dolosa]
MDVFIIVVRFVSTLVPYAIGRPTVASRAAGISPPDSACVFAGPLPGATACCVRFDSLSAVYC